MRVSEGKKSCKFVEVVDLELYSSSDIIYSRESATLRKYFNQLS